ncbi:MAG TPA: AMP-binding protein [Polyangiaceae bacterium]|jgi:acyl-coenzyme A synthetase/AMP-(fatty) acid ligase|nr:MAG: Long-chain-fatty-acid--CoA ligase [Deltaproteobacteria bacterium ADurb.Bin207]HNZ24069.1 AMP-binding protein [Polyangiaceae bacterium]HOD21860.1 AMP-binding protein [Polyangiaceae bacterium]HOE50970.1 AMP-binding protein [Polyangiaceae bacterium]HOH01934.1 AMP-binding protein [Polyangiaceae bacterium]
MNCVDLFVQQAKRKPNTVALWSPDGTRMTFEELLAMAGRTQRALRDAGVKPGSSVLVVELPGPRLYAIVLAVFAMGATVIAVEPWLPVGEVDRVIRFMRPTLFIGGALGMAWGARVPAVRAISRWKASSRVLSARGAPLSIEDTSPETPALVAFTSGTTGQPKGVVRPQGYLIHQHDIYTRSLGLTHHEGPDLCIFANFVLANLASGRPSLLVSPRWSFKQLRAIDDLPDELQPRTLSCGPAFLAQILRNARLDKLASVHVGGALSDVSLWENAFDKWPDTHFLHVYGSSEAEPVAVLDARKAVAVSRARGFHQVLCVGKPVDAIRSRLEPNSLWVTGPHVCRWYVGNDRENLVHKRVDEHGNVWHDMGDRIEVRDDLWWYAGRASQPAEDFSWEQSVYHELGHSRAFIHRTNPGSVYLVGEGLRQNAERIKQQYRGIDRLICCPIYRDRRHRARIDRRTTLRKGAPWLPG